MAVHGCPVGHGDPSETRPLCRDFLPCALLLVQGCSCQVPECSISSCFLGHFLASSYCRDSRCPGRIGLPHAHALSCALDLLSFQDEAVPQDRGSSLCCPTAQRLGQGSAGVRSTGLCPAWVFRAGCQDRRAPRACPRSHAHLCRGRWASPGRRCRLDLLDSTVPSPSFWELEGCFPWGPGAHGPTQRNGHNRSRFTMLRVCSGQSCASGQRRPTNRAPPPTPESLRHAQLGRAVSAKLTERRCADRDFRWELRGSTSFDSRVSLKRPISVVHDRVVLCLQSYTSSQPSLGLTQSSRFVVKLRWHQEGPNPIRLLIFIKSLRGR